VREALHRWYRSRYLSRSRVLVGGLCATHPPPQ
jgi:hypothetical protein